MREYIPTTLLTKGKRVKGKEVKNKYMQYIIKCGANKQQSRKEIGNSQITFPPHAS